MCQRKLRWIVATTEIAESRPGRAEEARADAPHYSYQPALDGLRAFAVGSVMLYHASQSWAIGGFLGVDAFFVLSGFLITTLLITEWGSAKRINLAAFWIRRARRLLPALILVMIGILFYAAVFAAPAEVEKIRSDGFATLGYWRTGSSSSPGSRTSISSPSRRPSGTCGHSRSKSSST